MTKSLPMPNVHFHVLVPGGAFDGAEGFEHLPPPHDAAVQGVLETLLRRLTALLEGRGLFELEALPEDAPDALRLERAADLALSATTGERHRQPANAARAVGPCTIPAKGRRWRYGICTSSTSIWNPVVDASGASSNRMK